MLRWLYKKSDVFHYTGVVMETLMGATAVAMLVGLSLRRQSMWYISRRWPHSSLLCYYRKKLWPCVVVVGQYRKVDPSFFFWIETTENLNKKYLPSCCMYVQCHITHIFVLLQPLFEYRKNFIYSDCGVCSWPWQCLRNKSPKNGHQRK